MKFQLAIDEKGIVIFSENTKLEYGKDSTGKKVYYDAKCDERGMDKLWQLFEELDMIPRDAEHNRVHCRRMFEIKEVPVTD